MYWWQSVPRSGSQRGWRALVAALVLVDVAAFVGAVSAAAPAAAAVAGISVKLSSPAAGATAVEYQVSFNTSSAGALKSNGTITVSVPGAVLPSCVRETDLGKQGTTTKAGITFDACATGPATRAAPATGSRTYVSSGTAVPAAQRVMVELDGVANPKQVGTHSLTVKTSADGAASGSFKILAARHVLGTDIKLSSPAARATVVTYLVSFVSSPVGGLSADSTITVSAPGAVLPGCVEWTDMGPVKDAKGGWDESARQPEVATSAPGPSFSACASRSSGPVKPAGATTYISSGTPIAAGHGVRVELEGVANGSTAGKHSLTVSTSSDLGATVTYTLVPKQAVSTVAVKASTEAAGAKAVQYDVDFTISRVGALATYGTVTVSAPGSVLPGCVKWTDLGLAKTGEGTSYKLGTRRGVDTTAQSTSFDACAAGGTKLGPSVTYVTSGTAIAAGHRVQVELDGVSNPAATGVRKVTLETSSDGPGTAKLDIVKAKNVSALGIKVSRQAHTKLVTYLVRFQTSSVGALASEGTVTIAATGALLPNCVLITALGPVKSSPGGYSTSAAAEPAAARQAAVEQTISFDACAAGENNASAAKIYQSSGTPIPANERVEVELDQVAPPTGTGEHPLSVRTSSDGAELIHYSTGNGRPTGWEE